MRATILLLLILFPIPSLAKDKLWFSNQLEVGYGKVFVGETIVFEAGSFAKAASTIGLKLKLADNIKYKTFYLLEYSRAPTWIVSHYVGTKLSFKF